VSEFVGLKVRDPKGVGRLGREDDEEQRCWPVYWEPFNSTERDNRNVAMVQLEKVVVLRGMAFCWRGDAIVSDDMRIVKRG
jgi:hypothetical protein